MDHILGILGTLRHLITCQMSPTRLINQHHGVELIVFIIIYNSMPYSTVHSLVLILKVSQVSQKAGRSSGE